MRLSGPLLPAKRVSAGYVCFRSWERRHPACLFLFRVELPPDISAGGSPPLNESQTIGARKHNLLSSALAPNLFSFLPRMKQKLFGVLRRIGFLVLVVWTVVSLVTLLIELVPGDPAIAVLGEQATPEQLAQFRSKHGLDRPPFFFGFPVDQGGQRQFTWHGLNNRYADYWKLDPPRGPGHILSH